MLPASNRGSGTNLGSPDLCLTPVGTSTVTIPYLNTALQAQSQNAAKVVYVAMMNALNTGSTVSSSNGDEGGTAHYSKCGSCAYTSGAPTVYVESMPAIVLTSATSQNAGNCVGTVSTPGAANVLFTRQTNAVPKPGEGRALDAAALEELGACLDGPAVLEARMCTPAIGYVRLRVFSNALASEMAALLSGELSSAEALVVDLRGVPGGSLTGAVRLAGRFLPAGSVIARVHELDGDVRVMRGGVAIPWPHALVLLVDAGSASAAEVFAHALDHHQRARVVGTPTAGKSTVQRVVSQDEATWLATVAEVYGPSDTRIDGVGLVPESAHGDLVALACARLA